MLWIVIPTRNEAAIIGRNLERLHTSLTSALHEPWRILVADNGSTDATRDIVRDVAARYSDIELYTLDRPGKGHAVMTAWRYAMHQKPTPSHSSLPPHSGGRRRTGGGGPEIRSPHSRWEGGQGGVGALSDVFLFLDADLATDPKHVPELVAAIRGGADIAAASRYLPNSQTQRSVFRHCISRVNALLLRLRFGLHMADAPCGAKAVSARVVRDIVPRIQDDQWFFDTELCIRAQ
ncbi:MAG: glycosyltransferase, partial [bacterium]|nr:glycosyltransferase [bacterium]